MEHFRSKLNAFSALAEPGRLRMMAELAVAEERSVGELARGLALRTPAVSQHLNVLKTTGLVVGQRRGKRVYYRTGAGVSLEEGTLVIRLPAGEVRMNLGRDVGRDAGGATVRPPQILV